MAEPFELTHRPRSVAVLRVRVLPVLLALGCLVAAVASVVALLTRDLTLADLINAWFFVVGGTGVAAYVGHRAWRTWPAASPALVVLRMDDKGLALRRGRLRDDSWVRVPWSDLEAVSQHSFEAGGVELHRLTFRQGAGVPVPPYPPGIWDDTLRALGLSEAEVALTFVHLPTWDRDVDGVLGWLRAQDLLLPAE